MPLSSSHPTSTTTPDSAQFDPSFKRIALGMILTGASAVGFTMIAWVLIIGLLERRTTFNMNALWAGSLWLSALLSTGVVAYSRQSVRPVLTCTLAFGIFGFVFMVCEGPIFGAPSQGGDPSTTEFVVTNLISLPLGVFLAAELGCWLRARNDRRRPTDARV